MDPVKLNGEENKKPSVEQELKDLLEKINQKDRELAFVSAITIGGFLIFSGFLIVAFIW